MKRYIRVLVEMPISKDEKEAVRDHFAPAQIRIGNIAYEAANYGDTPGTEIVEFDLSDLPDTCATEAEPEPAHVEAVAQSESEQSQDVPTNTATNKHDQNLELVTAFTEKFGKPPHHKAKDASIEEALTNEA